MLKILNHLKTRLRTTKDVAKLALTGLLFCIPFIASHACSVHNHGCIYHGFNATVNTSYPTTNTDTSVVLYSIGKTPNTGTPSNVDFDNKVWIPELTGEKVNGNYTTPTGAYILNNTAYGTTHPPADTYAPDDRYRLVYPSQYQITFNQNSAVAKHTGDFNGAENGNIPNATGCPNMPNAANCEAVVVTGNVPTGFYDQQVRIFNSTGNPNPAVDLQVGVYTTGKARLVTPSHIDNRNETADFQSISGTGATTPLYRYEIVNTGYEPHAGGTAYFDQNRTYTTGYGKPYTSGSHIYQNRFDTTDTTRTKIYKYGAGEQSLQARNFSTKHLYLGEVTPPPLAVTTNAKFDLLAFVQNKSDADKFMSGFPPTPQVVAPPPFTLVAGNVVSNCKNYIECYQGTTQAMMPSGNQGLSYGNGIYWNPAINTSLLLTTVKSNDFDYREWSGKLYTTVEPWFSAAAGNNVNKLQKSFKSLVGNEVVDFGCKSLGNNLAGQGCSFFNDVTDKGQGIYDLFNHVKNFDLSKPHPTVIKMREFIKDVKNSSEYQNSPAFRAIVDPLAIPDSSEGVKLNTKAACDTMKGTRTIDTGWMVSLFCN